jgi:hypothetical protein
MTYERGPKIGKKNVTYYLNGPLKVRQISCTSLKYC